MERYVLLEIGVYMLLLTILAIPAGIWIQRAMTPKTEALWGDWKTYAKSLLIFHSIGVLFLFAILRFQGYLPQNPQNFPGVEPSLAFNTAISFITNTNWQAYAGESTLSHFAQMAGLCVQNFLSAATGLAVAFALMRAFTRPGDGLIGSFTQDIHRATLYVLLPFSIVAAILLLYFGVPQSFAVPIPIHGIQGQEQLIPVGPVASQEAIKMLGTNGGGYFNANSSHPFENPNPASNLLQMLLIFLIPAGLSISFGRLLKDYRQGLSIYISMALLFIAATLLLMHIESSAQIWEGKETRFGFLDSSLFAAITTSASCGAVNAMHSSFSALGGMIPLWLIQLGEVVFGGVGSGFYGMILFVILAVFLAGLMVGRTPEYLGKKIGPYEMKMVAIAILVTPLLALIGTAIALKTPSALAATLHQGPHGLTEILYAFSSASNNNGSAFAGLSANSMFYNISLGICMWFGRFGVILPVLAIAGSLASKKPQSESAGTLPTHGPLFIVFLCLIVLLVGALTYFPALALSPIAEALGGL